MRVLYYLCVWLVSYLIYILDVTDVGPKGIADFELCAGLCDKEGKSDLEIAVEEVEEECGYKVHPDQMEFVQKFCEYGARKLIYYVGKLWWFKGQIISKGLLVSSNSPKKQTNKFVLLLRSIHLFVFGRIRGYQKFLSKLSDL